MKVYWLSIFLIFTLQLPSFSQINHSEDQQFFNYLYNFQFFEASKVISNIDSTEESGRYNFLKSHYMRWYYLPMHQQEEDILNAYNEYLEATDVENDKKGLNHLYVNSALLKAEFNYNQGNYYKAFQQGAKVYNIVKNNLEEQPEQQELLFLSGLYHYFYHYYRSENPLYEPMMWFFKEGNKVVGLRWLQEVAKGESIAKTEALIYLSHINLRLENKPDSAYKYARMLHRLYPNNLKFYELLIESNLAKNKESELVAELIQELIAADKIYFKKYGITYNAVEKSKFGEGIRSEKIKIVKKALDYIRNNDGGQHLSSLLYYTLFELTGDKEYLNLKKDFENYNYVLTGYPVE
ncbi:hypothetical protein SAMN05661096_03254 [Marivirga sericea]|uniref:Tetratricopeptide repeat-containing protein n=1 Tax=Marivirga sericea TaxID=1028 RepID=A0A1X7KXS4_9BACT|nr:hypothetical protein [Marivirga sericea]SMG46255.1 hypothetical protein SAMN05661096_03254 [Marivirga sericea]